MAKKNRVDCHQMLDIISSVLEAQYISVDQNFMVETNTGGKCGSMQCQIDTKNEETLLCKFDQSGNNHKLFPYFKEVHGMVSMCDYILFVEDNNELVAFSIDLKDTIISPKQQTLIAKTFAEFIVNRIKVILGEASFPKPVRFRQIGIKTSCDKMTTKGYEKLVYDDDDYLVLPDYHHFYTRLLMDLK